MGPKANARECASVLMVPKTNARECASVVPAKAGTQRLSSHDTGFPLEPVLSEAEGRE
jgi:hypothetical protein